MRLDRRDFMTLAAVPTLASTATAHHKPTHDRGNGKAKGRTKTVTATAALDGSAALLADGAITDGPTDPTPTVTGAATLDGRGTLAELDGHTGTRLGTRPLATHAV